MFPILSLIIFRQFKVCWCGAPSLTRSRVCSFQFLPGIASAAFLRSESHGTHDHILLSQIWDSPNLEGQVPIFISHRSQSQSQSYITTDSQAVSMSWCRAQSGTFDQRPYFFVFFFKVTVLCYLGRPLWRDVGSVICHYLSLYNTHFTITIFTLKYLQCVIHIYNKIE
jgi:hypothetical protein